jgi:hypothetical protein
VEFVEVPQIALDARPWGRKVDVGPPPDVSDEHCAVAHATFERIQGGPHDGVPCFRVYAHPDRHELAMLEAGALIEISFYGAGMPMHSVGVIGISE